MTATKTVYFIIRKWLDSKELEVYGVTGGFIPMEDMLTKVQPQIRFYGSEKMAEGLIKREEMQEEDSKCFVKKAIISFDLDN